MTEDITTWLRDQATLNPKSPALMTLQSSYDYERLLAHVQGAAARYIDAGLLPGRSFAIISRYRARMAVAAYLALHHGSGLLPMAADGVTQHKHLADCRIHQAIVDDPDCMGDAIKAFPSHWLVLDGPRSTTCERRCPPERTQLFVLTSGTSGTPRAVMLSARNLAASVDASLQRVDLDTGDLWLNCLPLVHIGGLAILLRCLRAGAGMSLHERFFAEHVWTDLRARPITHISLIPTMLARLLEYSHDTRPPDTLRHALIGGAPLSKQLARRAWQAGWPVRVAYGMAETASHVTLNCDMDSAWQPGNVGHAIPGARISIVDEYGHAVAGEGHIRIGGPMVATGYADGGDDTSFDTGFISNDIGRLDDAGALHVIGRADDVLIVGGRNIHPLEVERLLLNCPGVTDAAVTSRADIMQDAQLIACWVGDATIDQVTTWSQHNIPSPLRPRKFVHVDQLPRNAMGKLLRNRLLDLALN